MLKWLDSTEVDKFADWLTAELLKRYPPEGLDTDVKKATQRLRKVHDSIFLRVESFAKDHQLNIYKRARLGNRIKWALREAGYPEGFLDSFTHEVVSVVTVINTTAKQSPQKR